MNLLISGCLLGLRCRFDGGSKPLPRETLTALKRRFDLIPVCPEQLGGLASPREPSEQRDGRYFSRSGTDVTQQYLRGAEEALRLARFFDCRIALLKERSPSCGCDQIYDGSFTGTLIPGRGAAAALLADNGVAVFGESRVAELLAGKF